MTEIIKRAFSSKDDKILAVLVKNPSGSYDVISGFLGYTVKDVSYKVASNEFEEALILADFYLTLKGKYYIIDYTKETK